MTLNIRMQWMLPDCSMVRARRGSAGKDHAHVSMYIGMGMPPARAGRAPARRSLRACVFTPRVNGCAPWLALRVGLSRRLLGDLLKLVLIDPGLRYVKGYAIDGPCAQHNRYTPK